MSLVYEGWEVCLIHSYAPVVLYYIYMYMYIQAIRFYARPMLVFHINTVECILSFMFFAYA